MLVKDFFDYTLIPISPTEVAAEAAERMLAQHQLVGPVVNKDSELLGLLSAETVFSNKPGSKKADHFLQATPTTLVSGDAWYFAFDQMENEGTDIAPIVEDGKYIGCVTKNSLIEYFGKLSAFRTPGGILVLKMGVHDYMPSQIARIVEANEARLILLMAGAADEQMNIEVTIKVSGLDLSSIIETFERFNYTVIYSFQKSGMDDLLNDRLKNLQNYLSI